MVALVAWAFAGTETTGTLATRISLFVAASAVVLFAMRRHRWAALVVIGFMALGMRRDVIDVPSAWSIIFVAATSLGTVMWLRKWEGTRWILASLPFWAMSRAVSWFEFVALGLALMGLAIAGIGPTLPGRRRSRDGEPLAHMANGPLETVVPRVFPAARPSRVIRVLTWIFVVLTIVLAALAGRGWNVETSGALSLSSAIIAATFAFSNWFSGRVRLRIDEHGLHSRTMFLERTIPWTDIAWLTLRYVFLPGLGVRVVYYVVRSPTREFAFTSSMAGAAELQAAIERATGLAWPAPEITPTM